MAIEKLKINYKAQK